MQWMVMATFDHRPGSRSRDLGVAYPQDFLLDATGSRQALGALG